MSLKLSKYHCSQQVNNTQEQTPPPDPHKAFYTMLDNALSPSPGSGNVEYFGDPDWRQLINSQLTECLRVIKNVTQHRIALDASPNNLLVISAMKNQFGLNFMMESRYKDDIPYSFQIWTFVDDKGVVTFSGKNNWDHVKTQIIRTNRLPELLPALEKEFSEIYKKQNEIKPEYLDAIANVAQKYGLTEFKEDKVLRLYTFSTPNNDLRLIVSTVAKTLFVEGLGASKQILTNMSIEQAEKEFNDFIASSIERIKIKENELKHYVSTFKDLIKQGLTQEATVSSESDESDLRNNFIESIIKVNVTNQHGIVVPVIVRLRSGNSYTNIEAEQNINLIRDISQEIALFRSENNEDNVGLKGFEEVKDSVIQKLNDYIKTLHEKINNIDFSKAMFSGPYRNEEAKQHKEKYNEYRSNEYSNRRYAYDLSAEEYKQFNQLMFERLLHLFELYYKVYRLSGWMNPLEAQGNLRFPKGYMLQHIDAQRMPKMPEHRRRELDEERKDSTVNAPPDSPVTQKRSLIRPMLNALNSGTDSLIHDLLAVLNYWGDMRGDTRRFASVIKDLQQLKNEHDPLKKFTKFVGQGGPLNVLHHTGPIADYFFMPPNYQDTGLEQSQSEEDIRKLHTLEELNNLSKHGPEGSNKSYEAMWEDWVQEQNA